MEQILSTEIRDIITRALEEDLGSGDVSTGAIINGEQTAEAIWIARDDGVITGLDIARDVFARFDPQIEWTPMISDGERAESGAILVKFLGSAGALLAAERTALNIVQRMCGIATSTSQMVELAKPFGVEILDTRKTAPGLRVLDKMAVKAGGGVNHRMGLYDMVMIKENHIRVAGSITSAVEQARKACPELKVEVETTNMQEVHEAAEAGADIIMLDNMSTDIMRKAVVAINGRAKTEASGNITLDRIQNVAETGVNFISCGSLTHSVKAFDISQQIVNIN